MMNLDGNTEVAQYVAERPSLATLFEKLGIEVGKKADLALLDLSTNVHSISDSDESIYSDIVYSSSVDSINSVMIEGEWKVLNKKSLLYDQQELNQKSKDELKKLLKRVKI